MAFKNIRLEPVVRWQFCVVCCVIIYMSLGYTVA